MSNIDETKLNKILKMVKFSEDPLLAIATALIDIQELIEESGLNKEHDMTKIEDRLCNFLSEIPEAKNYSEEIEALIEEAKRPVSVTVKLNIT